MGHPPERHHGHLVHDRRTLRLRLTTFERVAGLRRGVEVPLAAVREVQVVDDPLGAVRGFRVPGLGLPGLLLIGTWRRRGHRAFVVARRRRPGVRVILDGADLDELLISVADAPAVAERLRAAAAEQVVAATG